MLFLENIDFSSSRIDEDQRNLHLERLFAGELLVFAPNFAEIFSEDVVSRNFFKIFAAKCTRVLIYVVYSSYI